jgi:TfoX/Sxy family transcriptional regulator of competence genes
VATDRSFVEYAIEQSGLAGELTVNRLFGEFALYLDGKVVAFACDNSLLLKPSAAMPEVVSRLPGRPPYPGAKDYPVLDELLDDPDLLRSVLLATAAALPAPKPKGPPRKRAATRKARP